MDVSFIIVNYKSEHFLEKCLLSLDRNLNNVSSEIIIINNDEKILEKIANLDISNLQIINRGANDGFGKACNLGAKIATGKVCFFLNPDTECVNLDLPKLLTTLENAEIGIVAPQLITPVGNTQPWSCGYEINLLEILRNNLGIIRSKKLWNITSPTKVDWVSGAAFAIKKSIFDSLAGFDETFFMYFEDTDLCKRVNDSGKKIAVFPNMRILHFSGQSASGTKEQKKYYYASQDYYFKKHRSSLELFFLKLLRSFVSLFQK